MEMAFPYLYNRTTIHPDGWVQTHEVLAYFVDKEAFYKSLLRWNSEKIDTQKNNYIYSETQKQYEENQFARLTKVPFYHIVHTGNPP